MSQQPDPKWRDVWGRIHEDEDFPHRIVFFLRVTYGTKIYTSRQTVDMRDIDLMGDKIMLDQMVKIIDRTIEEESGMNDVTMYKVHPDNYETLRNHGFGTKAIADIQAHDKAWNVETHLILIDSLSEAILKPLSGHEHALVAELYKRIDPEPGLDNRAFSAVIRSLTHPDILPLIEALIEAKNPKIKE